MSVIGDKFSNASRSRIHEEFRATSVFVPRLVDTQPFSYIQPRMCLKCRAMSFHVAVCPMCGARV